MIKTNLIEGKKCRCLVFTGSELQKQEPACPCIQLLFVEQAQSSCTRSGQDARGKAEGASGRLGVLSGYASQSQDPAPLLPAYTLRPYLL